MPMVLDNPMGIDLPDVDDLFGDPVGLGLPLRAHNKQLSNRMQELRAGGCSQSVDWSRLGTIASITSDGLSVELRYLRTNPSDGSWGLSDPTIYESVRGTPTVPLVHVEWGPASTPELAVIDALGRVSVVAFPVNLNFPYHVRRTDHDPADDLNAVVGCLWLPVAPGNPQKPYNVLHGPAVRQGPGYHYESSFVHTNGPNHPFPSKSAFLTFTGAAHLRLFWAQNNNKIEETVLELESLGGCQDSFTHAAFAADKKYLFLACVSSREELSLVRVDINWGAASQPTVEKTAMPPNTRLNPSLADKVLATTSLRQRGSDGRDQSLAPIQLSQLRVLAPVMDRSGKSMAPAVIVGICLQSGSIGDAPTHSVIYRWEASETKQSLHPTFEQMNRGNGSSGAEEWQLRRLEPLPVPKVIVDMRSAVFGSVIILTFADGSVEHRDRFTFEELYTTEEHDKIVNLRQVGWKHGETSQCTQVAFSPSFCSMAQLGDDGKIRWVTLQSPTEDMGNSMENTRYASTLAALTVTTATVIWHQGNFDDLLAICKPLLKNKPRFAHDLVGELIRLLKIQVDYSEEQHMDSLVRNPTLLICLSILNSLGFRGELQPRSFQSKFATVALNVRNMVILITLASNTPTSIKDRMSPLDEYEVVDALAGTTRWTLELFAWLTDCLFELVNDDSFLNLLSPDKFNALTQYLHKRNDVSLHLLLSSSTRGFLSAMCRRIGVLDQWSGRAIEYHGRQSRAADATASARGRSQRLLQSYLRMKSIISSSMINVQELDKLLSALGSDIKEAYALSLPNMVQKGSNPPQGKQIDQAVKAARIHCELLLLTSAAPHTTFLPVLKKLFQTDLPVFRKLTDPARLFFADYSLLEIQDDQGTLEARRGRPFNVDAFKREVVEMDPARQWRRCTRCCAVMEDVVGTRPGYTFVLRQQQRCYCGGNWALLPKGKLR